MYFKSLAIVTSLVASALAADINIMVGVNGTTTFTPSQVTAAVGDIVNFVFVAGNHSVWQSTFADPCSLKSAGFSNDFQPVMANATNSFTTIRLAVNTTAPIWFYCPQTQPAIHCHKGMVGAINPTANMTFSAFQAKALALANATTSAPTTPTTPTSNTTSPTNTNTTTGSTGTGTKTNNGVLPSQSMVFTSTTVVLLGLVASAMLTL